MLKIKWIGQSGYILNDGETEICIDPYLSDAVNKVSGYKRMVEAPFLAKDLKSDAVICTHNHLDHVDGESIIQMKKDCIRFFAPSDAKKTLLECGVTDYNVFDEGACYQLGNFKIEAVYADHTVPAVGVIVKHNGITLYFSGDTYYNTRLEKLSDYDIDIMFICINGKLGNMNVEEAVKLTRIIKPNVGIPNHYGMFEKNTENPEKYTSELECGKIIEYNKEYDVSELLGGKYV